MAGRRTILEAFDFKNSEHVHALNELIEEQHKENKVARVTGIVDPKKPKPSKRR